MRHALRPTPDSRFAGRALAELFGLPGLVGDFSSDTWDMGGHPQIAAVPQRRVLFGDVPEELRQQVKEFVVLAARPALCGDLAAELIGVRPKNLLTIIRMQSHLVTDLSWLLDRAGSLASVLQADFDAWHTLSELRPDYRRLGAMQTFARYCAAMSPSLDRFKVLPWPGRSALNVAGGPTVLRRENSTAPLSMDELAPWVLTALYLIERGDDVIRVADTLTASQTSFPLRARAQPMIPWVRNTKISVHEVTKWLAAACIFCTAAFTGMRAGELDTIPRAGPVEPITVLGQTRWLVRGYLCKGQRKPKAESWIVPPVVKDAIERMQELLEALRVPVDRVFPPTGQAPLFDRRALSLLSRDGTYATMRLERAAMALAAANAAIARDGGVPACADPSNPPSGRELRRTFARIVAERPNGPQAAMDQFKWQRPEVASGYFVYNRDAVAEGQRELYDEVAELRHEMVVDALVSEYDVWERQVLAGQPPSTPAGPDGRRKRDLFETTRSTLQAHVEEDPRRLRRLLSDGVGRITLTDFGWCDFNAEHAACGGTIGPALHRCEPNACLNHATPSTAIAAHQVRFDRFRHLARDRTMPALAREQAAGRARAIKADLGDLIVEGRA